MKIVIWNCNGALRNKVRRLDDLDADVIVAQECEDPARSTRGFREWAGEYLWIGNNKNKGLGVFARKDTSVQPLNWSDDGLQLFLPCRLNDDVNLIAVWTKQAQPSERPYIGQLWQYLQKHKNKINSSRTVICGDFNSNRIWDKPGRNWNHSDVVRELESAGLRSLYHEQEQEHQGQESKPTLYMYRDIWKPYHIDYIFASRDLVDPNLNELVVGDPESWLEHSDHMPIIARLGG